MWCTISVESCQLLHNCTKNRILKGLPPAYNSCVTLKVTQGHCCWCHLIGHIWFPISLLIDDCSFWCASPRLWNRLPASFRQPHPCLSVSVSPLPTPVISPFSADLSLITSNSLTLSLLALNLPALQILPTLDSLPPSGPTTRIVHPDRIFWAILIFVFSSSRYFFCFWFHVLDWLAFHQLLGMR